jgi:hypothetical protein
LAWRTSGPQSVRAFGLYPVNNRRVPHISLVFREMWDTEDLTSAC